MDHFSVFAPTYLLSVPLPLSMELPLFEISLLHSVILAGHQLQLSEIYVHFKNSVSHLKSLQYMTSPE